MKVINSLRKNRPDLDKELQIDVIKLGREMVLRQ